MTLASRQERYRAASACRLNSAGLERVPVNSRHGVGWAKAAKDSQFRLNVLSAAPTQFGMSGMAVVKSFSVGNSGIHLCVSTHNIGAAVAHPTATLFGRDVL
jgi:hypothetical protein